MYLVAKPRRQVFSWHGSCMCRVIDLIFFLVPLLWHDQWTHICRMDFPIIIVLTSPLSILGESGVFFHFYFIFFIEIPVSKQCRRVLWRLILIYTVCLCPKNRTPGLYGFMCHFLVIYCQTFAKSHINMEEKFCIEHHHIQQWIIG